MGKRIVTWLRYGVLSLVFFICMNSRVYAQLPQNGQCVDVPTGPGQALNDLESSITIYASSDTISPTAPVTLHLAPGSWGRPPYTWQVSGTGYTLDKGATQSDPEEVILTSAGGT
jgi:hypothetical protein